MKKTTYWIYYGKRILTSVLLYPGATDGDVIGKACADHARVPMNEPGLTPYEWDLMLRAGTVKTYDKAKNPAWDRALARPLSFPYRPSTGGN